MRTPTTQPARPSWSALQDENLDTVVERSSWLVGRTCTIVAANEDLDGTPATSARVTIRQIRADRNAAGVKLIIETADDRRYEIPIIGHRTVHFAITANSLQVAYYLGGSSWLHSLMVFADA